MNEYSVSNYEIFNNAQKTLKNYSNKLTSNKEILEQCQKKLEDNSIFMGPIQEECVKEANKQKVSIQTQIEKISEIDSYMQQTSTTYKSGDQKASNTFTNNDILNTNTTSADTSKTYGISTDAGAYDSNNSYTNSKNGLQYKLYDQGLGEWSSYTYDDGRDMRTKGCMLTAAATVSSSSDSSITPGNLFNEHRHDFVADSVPNESNGYLSSQSLAIDNNTNQTIINNLQQGNPSIIMVKGPNQGGSSSFTSSQHYMALLDISDDGSQIFVGNSHTTDGGNHSANGWYPTDEVLTSVREATVFTPIKT